jgi:hypothetical protein
MLASAVIPSCGTVAPTVARKPAGRLIAEFGLVPIVQKPLARALSNRKRPAGEAGRFWGYYREERYVSLYMWIRGR